MRHLGRGSIPQAATEEKADRPTPRAARLTTPGRAILRHHDREVALGWEGSRIPLAAPLERRTGGLEKTSPWPSDPGTESRVLRFGLKLVADRPKRIATVKREKFFSGWKPRSP